MIGGLTMKSFYKNKFALSDQGAEALTKASISSFLYTALIWYQHSL